MVRGPSHQRIEFDFIFSLYLLYYNQVTPTVVEVVWASWNKVDFDDEERGGPLDLDDDELGLRIP